MNFPPPSDIVDPSCSEYEKEFIQTEYGFGLSYYLSRLDQLTFSGDRVLDAGCGVGQWSVALSRRFERVEAVDCNTERLAVLENVASQLRIQNVGVREASIEHLPYSPTTFDAVFCYGVIMFTQVERVLREFYRVMRPGGRVYVCLNADGWSRYLIEERGCHDDVVRLAGQRVLYATYWWRAIQNGILSSLRKKATILRGVINTIPLAPWMVRFGKNNHPVRSFKCRLAERLLQNSRAGTDLWEAVSRFCGNDFLELLADDCIRVLRDSVGQPQCGISRAYQPGEFASLISAAGFDDFQWAIEGGLTCENPQVPVEPRYSGTFADDLAVWECLFVRPDYDQLQAAPSLASKPRTTVST
jgi:SAM-dependent methyltransferase